MERFKLGSVGGADRTVSAHITFGEIPPAVIEDIPNPTREQVDGAIDAAFVPVLAKAKKMGIDVDRDRKIAEAIAKAKTFVTEVEKGKNVGNYHEQDKEVQEIFASYLGKLGLSSEIENVVKETISPDKASKVIRQYFRIKNREIKAQESK